MRNLFSKTDADHRPTKSMLAQSPLERACKNNRLDVACNLLFSGSDPNQVFSDGGNPLFYAISREQKNLVAVLIGLNANIVGLSYTFLRFHTELGPYVSPVIDKYRQKILAQPPLTHWSTSKIPAIAQITDIIFVDPQSNPRQISNHFDSCYQHRSDIYKPLLNFAAWGALGNHYDQNQPLKIIIGRGEHISHIYYPPSEARGRYVDNRIYIAGDVEFKERFGAIVHELVHFAVCYCQPLKQSLEQMNATLIREEIETAHKAGADVYSLQEVFLMGDYQHQPSHHVEEVLARVPQLIFLLGINQGIKTFSRHLPLLFSYFKQSNQIISRYLDGQSTGLFKPAANESKLDVTQTSACYGVNTV